MLCLNKLSFFKDPRFLKMTSTIIIVYVLYIPTYTRAYTNIIPTRILLYVTY